MKQIFIVGSINQDLVITTPKMPVEGETISGDGFFTANGGKGANQAVAASRLGGKVIMCGVVGNDAFGKEMISDFVKDGIDVSNIRIAQDEPTGVAVIVVSNGNNRIILNGGANTCLTKEDIDNTLKKANKGDIYLTQLENPIDIIGYGLQKAKEKEMYVILNPAPANNAIKSYLKYCDLVTPNETELEILGGKDELLKQVESLIVTLGSKGFEITDKNGSMIYPCDKIVPVDTTAAGDTLCGGLAAYLAEGNSLEESAKFGSKAATLACTRKGAQPSIPKRNEII